MVQTRRQYSAWVRTRGDHYESEEENEGPCEECREERDNTHNIHHPTYATNDTCHRHRSRDDSPYDVVVRTYRRRKP